MSSIEWTQKTWNPTTGCTKISKECDNCYAEKETNRLQHNPKITKYRAGFDVVVEHPDTLDEPHNWSGNKIVFVNSMSDLFHKDISLSFIKRVFKVMNDTPQHTYQILTKRDSVLLEYSKELNWTDNIWMGVSVGSQVSVRKIERLTKCDAKHKFLSIEPLIGEIEDYSLNGIDWVIVGGESGHNARPIKPEWVESIRQKCLSDNVAFFFKQWGHPRNNPNQNDPTIHLLHRYHSKGGSQLNGVTYWENPLIDGSDKTPTINLFDKEYPIMDNINNMKTIWKLKSFLPFSNKDVYDNLKKDIKKNGIFDPIIFWTNENGDNLVLEGHTRIRIALELGWDTIPCQKVSNDFKSLDEIKLWMVKNQLNRRNLSTVERVMLAYNSKETIEKLAANNLSIAGKDKQIEKPIDTYSEIAKIAGVGRGTMSRYMKVMNSNNEGIINRLHKGNLSINSASNLVKEAKPKAPKKEAVEKLTFIMFTSFEEAQNALLKDEIDIIIASKSKDVESFLKRTNKAIIGVVNV